MSILSDIASYKRLEVESRKQLHPVALLERMAGYGRPSVSMAGALLRRGSSGIIAEYKRKSPSKGIINHTSTVESVTAGYVDAGAAGLSVLTDGPSFGGSLGDLDTARAINSCPILRKEFIVDPYQVIEAKAHGADVVLLIAAILTADETLALATLSRSLGMETILEVHSREELGHLNEQINILGVNNRNLADFSVSLDISLSLAGLIPGDVVAISESGIRKPEDISLLKQAGYRGFLVGEQFMATADPAGACHIFINSLQPND
jgi:indole-3-glycerol phosphate synthase